MIYPESAVEKLGFNQIKELIKDKCLSEQGRYLVERMQPLQRFSQMEKFLLQTRDFKDILEADSPFPLEKIHPIKPYIEKVRIEGIALTEEEFFQILLSVKNVFAALQYFKERPGTYASLESLYENLQVNKSLVREIEAVIDGKGKIKANASKELMQLSASHAKAENEAHKRLEQLYKMAQGQGWTAEGSLTYRNGRLCIPLLAENKRKIKGFVHDESSTGQTVFLEPEEVFALNNKVRDLAFEIRREIARILTELTSVLRPALPELLAYHDFLAKLDFIRAKALFAIESQCSMPQLVKEPIIEIFNAQHPLLALSFRREGKTVVPLNIKLDERQRIVVISGPNAGGKSVALKTIALLQIMAQSGLLIPADGISRVGMFRQFFVDIGDDQSLESDLSTYSAHLSKMRYFLEQADQKTLVLIDEFGTGTDPQFGGPIAEAVLQELHRKKVRGVVTTHYSSLKHFASETQGIENASMLFDNVAMLPLYLLQIGKPGSSYAFEIAQKTGLPRHVIDLAKDKLGVQQKKVEYLLVDLEREKKRIQDANKEIELKQARLAKAESENRELQDYLEQNKAAILKQAKVEAQQILKGANKLVENTISKIRESQADKSKTRALRKELQDAQKQTQDAALVSKPKPEAAGLEIKAGDWVKVIETGNVAQVLEVAKSNVILAFGDLRSVVKRNRLEKVRRKDVPKSLRKSSSGSLTESLADFHPEIDVRGQRTEEALYEIEKYLDKAIMLGFPSLKIIHGKGNGILRKMIRDQLRNYSQVNRMEDEHADRGGDGITYVFLN